MGTNSPKNDWGLSPTCPVLGQPDMIILAGLNLITRMAEISIQRLHGLIMAKRSTVERQSTLEKLHRPVPKELTKSFTVGTLTNPPNQSQEEQDEAEYLANEPDMTPHVVSSLVTTSRTHMRPEQGSLDRLITVWMDKILLNMTWIIMETKTVSFLAFKLILIDPNQGNPLLGSPELKCGSLDKMDLYLLSQEITLMVAISIGQKNLYLSISREITLAEANQGNQMDLYLSLLQEITLAEANQDLYLSLLQEITLAEANQDLYLSLLLEITLAKANQDHQIDLYLSISREITLATANQNYQMDLYLSLLQEITLAEANQDLYLSLLLEITLAKANQDHQMDLYLSLYDLSLLQEILATLMSPKAQIPALSLVQEILMRIMSPNAHIPAQNGLKTALLAVYSLFGLNSPPCHIWHGSCFCPVGPPCRLTARWYMVQYKPQNI